VPVEEGCGPVEEKLFEVAAYAARLGAYERVEEALRTGYSLVGDYEVTFEPGDDVLCVTRRGREESRSGSLGDSIVAAWAR